MGYRGSFHFRNTKMVYQHAAIMAIMILVTFFTTLLVTARHNRSVQEEQTADTLGYVTSQIGSTMITEYSSFENAIYGISSDISQSRFINKEDTNLYLNVLAQEKYESILTVLSGINDDVDYSILQNGKMKASSYASSEILNYPRTGTVIDGGKFPYVMSPVDFCNSANQETLEIISFVYPIFNPRDLSVAANIVMDVPVSHLAELMAPLDTGSSSGFLIHGSDIIYSSGSGKELPFGIDELEHGKTVILDDEFWEVKSLGLDFWLVGMMEILEPRVSIASGMAVTLGIIFLSIILMTVFYYLTVDRPINDIVKGLRDTGSGNFSSGVKDLRTSQEITSLYDGFHSMQEQIVENNRKIEEETALKERAQLMMLQQQINPHFLFNALEALIGFSWENRPEKVESICMDLSRLLRYNLYWDSGSSTVENEYEICLDYINIISTVYADRFAFRSHMDDGIRDVKCLRFILQPIIENSVKHGFRSSNTGHFLLEMDISRKDERHISARIHNNGNSFREETRKELMEKMADLRKRHEEGLPITSSTREKIGVLNVYERLLLTYGSDIDIEISRESEEGTTITLTFPSDPGEEGR